MNITPLEIPGAAWDAVVQASPIADVNAAKGSAWDINDLQEKAVTAAAPHIVAAELQRLMDDAFPDEDSDYHYGCERLLDLVRDRIPELRGDRKAEQR